MSNYDINKQYHAEIERIRRKIEEEENPYHRQHIQEFNEMMDEKIRTQVPMYIQQLNEKQWVDVQAYFSGEPATNANIVKGVREMVVKALKRVGMKSR